MRTRHVVLALMTLATGSLRAQTAGPSEHDPSLPFGVGEELVYRASLGRFGGNGRGVMRVEAGEVVRGRATLLLLSDLRGRVAFFSAEDRTRSWFDPVSLRSLRFSKTERHPLSTWDESVELFPEERRWVTSRDSGELTTDAPLDELSFIYFLRTLPLDQGDSLLFERHYDPERNPTRVRVVGRETITVPAGEFETIVVEMVVRDERRYGGEGVVRLHLTDDERRLPVRIASTMRTAGATVLSLESVTIVTGRTAQR